MKNIAAQMVNFDREQMRRIANNMPEQYDEKPQVQDVKSELVGRETYEHQALAVLMGVAKSTWTTTHRPHWLAMRGSAEGLDRDALISVMRVRSRQQSLNLEPYLAK